MHLSGPCRAQPRGPAPAPVSSFAADLLNSAKERSLMGVLTGCKPRPEVLKGDLDDAIFAADFYHVITGEAPPVYGNPALFFRNTHPAERLRKVISAVFGRLASTTEAGITVGLSTGFGGGKTHTLIAMWHLAKNIADATLGTELLPHAGRPKSVKVVAVDAGKAGVPVFDVHEGIQIHSLWGEIFYQLAGRDGLKILGEADDPEASPHEGQIRDVMPAEPALFLLDELVIYMAKLSERGQGNLLGFITTLAGVVGARHQAALVVTDPREQRAYAGEADRLARALPGAGAKLDDIFGRKASEFDPIGGESARVIVRRLFEHVDTGAAQAASALYHDLYQRVSQAYPGLLPVAAKTPEYDRLLLECYPFHPRLLETAQERLSALGAFQKSRGVLRLFARIIRDVWESGRDLEVISAGDVDWSSDRIKADLLQRLDRDRFIAAVEADVITHAGELDGEEPRGIHRRVASAILLESIQMAPNAGLDRQQVTLAVLRPDEAGPEPVDAMDRLAGVCWHLYPMAGGDGYQFRYEPNVLKQIEEQMAKVPLEDARGWVMAEAQAYFQGPVFKLVSLPASPRQVPESRELQLVLAEDEAMAKRVCRYEDDSVPEAPMPRRFLNSILAVAPNIPAFNIAVERAQRLIAATRIEEEAKGEQGKLVKEQLGRVRPGLVKRFRLDTMRAFDRVVLASGTVYRLEEPLQTSDDDLLRQVKGQAIVKKFLDEKKLIYQPGDTLDLDRLMKEVLPGAVPEAGKQEVYSARAVHERFLSMKGLRLLPNSSVVSQTILKAVEKGLLAVRLEDGSAYCGGYRTTGDLGERRKSEGMLTTIDLDDATLLSRADSAEAVEWMREDVEEAPKEDDSTGTGGGGLPDGGGGIWTPPDPPKVTATTWAKALEYASGRPLLSLRLTAGKPADAALLAAVAQPFGAESVTLDVDVDGSAKQGGTLSFKACEVSLNHPARPLETARTLFNALAEGAAYEAVLTLSFGSGRSGMAHTIEQAAEKAGEAISPTATFGKTSEAKGGAR